VTEPSKTARSVGETLRHAREDQNLTLDQVSQALHIRARFLEALEASNIRALPSQAQSRGFLRLYAEYLGLDPSPLLARWQPVDQPVVSTKEKTSPPTAQAKRILPIQQLAEKIFRPGAANIGQKEATETGDVTPRSEQMFKAIADRLVRQREALEMSIEEVALFSKIKPQTLQLLEKMDMNELPSPVIVRGLLLNYASALRMDEEELLSFYAEALQARRDERNAGSPSRNTPGTRSTPAPLIAINSDRLKMIDWKGLGTRLTNRFPIIRKYFNFDLLVGGILIIILAVVIIWAAASTLSLTAERVASQATLPGRSEILAAGGTLETETSTMITITPTPEAGQVASPEGGTGNGEGQAGVPVQPAYLVTLPANADAAFRVTIRPLQTAFVQIWVDGRLAYRGRMTSGADYPFNATRRVELLTGDASAVQVFFNATDLGILGISGEVVHLVYTVRGAETITPTVTLTYTPTPRPSATPRPTTTRRPTRTPNP
jgi:cytoskeleton protein RodZ